MRFCTVFLLLLAVAAVTTISTSIGDAQQSGRTCANGVCTGTGTTTTAGLGTPLSLFKTYTLAGDYISSGVGVRGSGIGSITISGIPTGATIQAAFLYWETLGDGQAGTFNGNAISGTILGTAASPCWPQPSVTVYRADVSLLVASGGNGTYSVHLPDSGNLTVAPSTEGASLVLVYSKPGLPAKMVLLSDGAFTLPGTGNPFSLTITTPAPAVAPVQARMTHLVGDGQAPIAHNSLFVNGTLVGNDIFTGGRGPLWDDVTLDVSSLVPAGSTQINTSSPLGSDCLVWGAVVFSVTAAPVTNPIPLPPTVILCLIGMTGVGFYELWRRRRQQQLGSAA